MSSREVDEVRRGAAEGLGFLGDQRAVEQLILMLDTLILEDSDWPLKTSIARALGLLNNKQGVQPLIRLLKDERAEVVIQSAISLGDLGDTKAVPELLWLQSHSEDRFLGFAIKHYATEAIQKINKA